MSATESSVTTKPMVKLSAAQIEALRAAARGDAYYGNGIRLDTIDVLQRAGLVTSRRYLRRVVGRHGFPTFRIQYYCDWVAEITEAGRAYLVALAK